MNRKSKETAWRFATVTRIPVMTLMGQLAKFKVLSRDLKQ